MTDCDKGDHNIVLMDPDTNEFACVGCGMNFVPSVYMQVKVEQAESTAAAIIARVQHGKDKPDDCTEGHEFGGTDNCIRCGVGRFL